MEIGDLIQCVDRALDEFGSSAKQSVYVMLTLRKNITYEQAVMEPEILVQTLQEVFDDSSEIVKRAIILQVIQMFGFKKSVSSYDMVGIMKLALRRMSGISTNLN